MKSCINIQNVPDSVLYSYSCRNRLQESATVHVPLRWNSTQYLTEKMIIIKYKLTGFFNSQAQIRGCRPYDSDRMEFLRTCQIGLYRGRSKAHNH